MKKETVVVVINPELGNDNVICIADSVKAAEFYIENTLEQMVRNGYILRYVTLQTQTEE